MMRKLQILFFICLCAIVTLNANAAKQNWDKLIAAIIIVESEGKTNAVNKHGNCVGLLQITPICVKECNAIQKAKKRKTRYTLNDRYNEKKSKEMFALIQEKYNRSNNIETAIRLWNGGVGGLKNKRKTDSYFRKVMKTYKKMTA